MPSLLNGIGKLMMTGLCSGAGNKHADGDDGPYRGFQCCVYCTGDLQCFRGGLPECAGVWCGGSGWDHRTRLDKVANIKVTIPQNVYDKLNHMYSWKNKIVFD